MCRAALPAGLLPRCMLYSQPQCSPQMSCLLLCSKTSQILRRPPGQPCSAPGLCCAVTFHGEGSRSPPDSQPLLQDGVLVVDPQAAEAAHEFSHGRLRHAGQPGAGTQKMLCIAQVAGPARGPVQNGLRAFAIAIHEGNVDIDTVQAAEGCELRALLHAAQAHTETFGRCQQPSACDVYLSGGSSWAFTSVMIL